MNAIMDWKDTKLNAGKSNVLIVGPKQFGPKAATC